MLKPLDPTAIADTPSPAAGSRRSARAAANKAAAAGNASAAALPATANAAPSAGLHAASARGAATDTIRLLLQSSLPMLVQQELERMILAGELRAGAKINEADVALRLGVSRGPVREAFRALEESGLVRLEKNRGVFVRQVSVEEADEIYELRALLDEFVGRRVAQRAKPHEIDDLRSLVRRMDEAAGLHDLDAYHHANLTFHDRLVELAGNAKLVVMYRRLVNELNLYRRATIAQAGSLPVSSREHHDIVDKIAAHKALAAGRALYDHVMASRTRMHNAYRSAAVTDATKKTKRSTRNRAFG